MGLDARKPVFSGGGGGANNTSAGQPAHPPLLFLFESTKCKLATGEISII